MQQARWRRAQLLRAGDEAEGSEAAAVLGLTPATWIFENARVLTLDPCHPIAEALAVGGERVLAIGSPMTVRALAGRRTERIDCRGATVLPGLVDPHLHLFALAARDAHLDVSRFAGVDELLAAVRSRARQLAPGEWLRGEGLDDSRLGRLPTAAELDAAAPRNPVRLRHRSRHASVLNGRALRRLGSALRVERRDGSWTGLVFGREEEVGRLIGPLSPRVVADGLVATARELAALGLTTVADATPRRWAALAPLRQVMAAARFQLRVYAMRPPGTRPWQPARRLCPGPVKIMVHEEPEGLRPRPATLARRIARAAGAGEQVAVHCLGAPTLVAALAAFGALPRRLRAGHRLEHVAECPAPLIPRIAALGLTVVTNPAFVHWRGDVYRAETTASARASLYRARSLAAAGVPLAAASDAPVVPPSPWVGIAAARARRTASGQLLGAGERLGAAAALALFTRGAADALGERALGRLAPGGPADLIVVDPDPLHAPPDELMEARVRLTLIAGELAWGA